MRNQTANRLIFLMAVIVAAIKSCWIVSAAPMPSWIWGLLAIAAIALCIRVGKRPKVNPLLAALLGVCLLSIVVNRPDGVFRCYERWAYFALCLALASPLLSSPSLHALRLAMWRVSLIAMRIAVVASLIGYALYHLGAIPGGVVEDETWGMVSGVTTHQIILGILSAIIAIDSLVRLTASPTPLRGKLLAAHLLMCATAVFTLILAGSRLATASFLAGAVAALALGMAHNWRNALKVCALTIAIVAVFCFANGVGKSFVALKNKFEQYEARGGQLSSRIDRWEDRWEEFVHQPILGVGFCAQVRCNSAYDDHEKIFVDGQLEPGSSWLSVLSMTGILGGAIMLAFNILLLVRVWRRQPFEGKAQWLSLLILIWAHGIAEGWVYFAGSYLCFLYWLICGIAWTGPKPISKHRR